MFTHRHPGEKHSHPGNRYLYRIILILPIDKVFSLKEYIFSTVIANYYISSQQYIYLYNYVPSLRKSLSKLIHKFLENAMRLDHYIRIIHPLKLFFEKFKLSHKYKIDVMFI